MPRVDVVVDCPVHDSFRVQQVAGMFDVPVHSRSQESFSVEVPDRSEEWQIGAIVGPSGSGKTTIAKAAFPGLLNGNKRWPRNRAIVDALGKHSVRAITSTLTSVGFSSPPAWIKPYHVLSQGEQFRCNLAATLLSRHQLIVCDEFTSVVDRKVAKVASAAVSKAIRRSDPAKRLLAVTCHYDILPWLAPDWYLDMATGQLARGSLRREPFRLQIHRCSSSLWGLFKRTHYLSSTLPGGSRCYLARHDGCPVAFVAVAPQFGARREKRLRRIGRVVVLPDYQGIGIGGRVTNAVAQIVYDEGYRVRIVTGHPSMIWFLQRNAKWRIDTIERFGRQPGKIHRRERKRPAQTSYGRSVVAAEFSPE